MRSPGIVRSGKQVLLLSVAALLSVSGAIAVGILLFGEFGQTEGRVLATTALFAAYGLLALPAAILVDRRRLPALAVLILTLALAGALLAVSAVWRSSPSETHGNAVGSVTAFLVAFAQAAALVLRRPERDRMLVRGLFALSCVLAAVAAAMLALVLWAEIDSERYGRVLGAVIVLDVLAVALQPILARARPEATLVPLRLLLESGETRDVTVRAPDLAAAAASAIRQSEREGHRVVRLEVADTHREPSGG
jgi:MFS family permease